MPLDDSPHTVWEQEGSRISPTLDFRTSALVIGDDPVAAAEVALGIARVQARRRRVAIADVVGEVRPIEALLSPDAQYGLMDSFFQGVSLSKVAQAVDAARNLLLLPSGAAPIDHEGILSSPRWQQLAAGFRDAGALLLVIALPDAPGLDRLALALEGIVVVGTVDWPVDVPVLAQVRAETIEPLAAAQTPLSDAAFEETLHRFPPDPFVAHPSHGTPRVVPRRPTIELLETVRPVGPRPAPFWTGIGIAAAVIIGLVTWAVHHYAPGTLATRAVAAADTSASAALPPPVTDTIASRSEAAGEAAPSTTSPITGTEASDVAAGTAIANASDSIHAAAYGVAMAEVPGVTAANVLIDQETAHALPAMTTSPEPGVATGGPLFVVTGAFPQRAAADSLLRALRAHAIVKPTQGHVVRLPLALLVQRGVSADMISFFLNGYHLKGLPVYALRQPDGTLNLYAGAFDDVDAAQPMLYTLRQNGDQPLVVYRTGSAY